MITINNVNEETDHSIDSATDLMTALKSVSDVGKRTVDEVSSFADTILQLAERQDELKVAIADKERAVEEVSHQYRKLVLLNKMNPTRKVLLLAFCRCQWFESSI